MHSRLPEGKLSYYLLVHATIRGEQISQLSSCLSACLSVPLILSFPFFTRIETLLVFQKGSYVRYTENQALKFIIPETNT